MSFTQLMHFYSFYALGLAAAAGDHLLCSSLALLHYPCIPFFEDLLTGMTRHCQVIHIFLLVLKSIMLFNQFK